MRTREELERFGIRILREARTELFLSMRFLGRALDSLSYTMDLNTWRVGTDGRRIHFDPTFVFHLFLESPQKLDRLYLHMLLHCLFRHIYHGDGRDAALWNLSCDIQAESVLDGMDYRIIQRPPGAYREASYARLREAVKVLTAERLYDYFLKNPPDLFEMEELEAEFQKDDHRFWAKLGEEGGADAPDAPDPGNSGMGMPDSPPEDGQEAADAPETALPPRAGLGQALQDLDAQWKDTAEKLSAELESLGAEASEDLGSLRWYLRFQYKKRADYRDFLRRISVEREEMAIDPDSFDYGYYHYGMELYGNLPLIEENEFRVSRKVESLVIAIDTSASCKDTLVQRFLNETAGLLSDAGDFFGRVRILLLECDNRVQKELWLKDRREMAYYAEGFELRGGYGTDFRPVFQHVDKLIQSGGLPGLKGLLYFTDGYGAYPEHMRSYQTAFVFPVDQEANDDAAPPWAMKLYI